MITKSRYTMQDHVNLEVARRYSNELKIPFLTAVGNFPDWDVAATTGSPSIEVKCETTPVRTNKVAIEYQNIHLKQPSGVMATKADLWLHIALRESGFVAYEYDTNILRNLITKEGVSMNCGDNALCRIIPISVFEKHALRQFPFVSDFKDELMMYVR